MYADMWKHDAKFYFELFFPNRSNILNVRAKSIGSLHKNVYLMQHTDSHIENKALEEVVLVSKYKH